MSFLDVLLTKYSQLIDAFGNFQPRRKNLQIIGGTLFDSASTDTTILTVSGGTGGGQVDLTLANGLNSNINPNGLSYVRIGGPTTAFSIGGINWIAAPPGTILTFVNTTAATMSFVQGDPGTPAGNRLNCLTANGGPVVCRAFNGSASFVKDTHGTWNLLNRGWESQSPDKFDVRDFGAVSSTTTDCGPLFQAAANALFAAADGPGRIRIPKQPTGTVYYASTPVFDPFCHHWIGDGNAMASGVQWRAMFASDAHPLLVLGQTRRDPPYITYASTNVVTARIVAANSTTPTLTVYKMNMGLGGTTFNWWDFSAIGATVPPTLTSTFALPSNFTTPVTFGVTPTAGLASQFMVIPGAGRFLVTGTTSSTVTALLQTNLDLVGGSTVASGLPVNLIGNGLTVECFVDPLTNLGANENRCVVSLSGRRGSDSLVTSFQILITSVFHVGNCPYAVVTIGGLQYVAASSTSIPIGTPTHISVVYNYQDIRIFINGNLDTTHVINGGPIQQNPYESILLGAAENYYMSSTLLDCQSGMAIGSLRVIHAPLHSGSFTAPTNEHVALNWGTEYLMNFSSGNRPVVPAPAGYIAPSGGANLAEGWVVARVCNNAGNLSGKVWQAWVDNTVGYVNGSRVENIYFAGNNTCCISQEANLQAWADRCQFQAARGIDYLDFSYSSGNRDCVFIGANQPSVNLYAWGFAGASGSQFLTAKNPSISGFNVCIGAFNAVPLYLQGGFLTVGQLAAILGFAQPNTSGTGLSGGATFSLEEVYVFDDQNSFNVAAPWVQLSNVAAYTIRGGAICTTNERGETQPVYWLDGVSSFESWAATGTDYVNKAPPGAPLNVYYYCTAAQTTPVRHNLIQNGATQIMPETGSAGQGPVFIANMEDFGSVSIVPPSTGTYALKISNLEWFSREQVYTGSTGGSAIIQTPNVVGAKRAWLNLSSTLLTFSSVAGGTTVQVPAGGSTSAVLLATGWKASPL